MVLFSLCYLKKLKEVMKKLSLIISCLLLSNLTTFAAQDININGSNPEVLNKQNIMQFNSMQVEKKEIQTTPKTFSPDAKKDVTQKDLVKGTLTYNPKFKLDKIIFKGNKIYSDRKLSPLAKDLVGKEVYLEDVMNLAVKVSRYYQQRGYITSYAYIEQQEVNNGTVVITVKESKVAEKTVNGNRWEREYYLRNIALGGRGLSHGKVFNARALQGAMKNLNKENYLKASAEINLNKKEDTVIKLNVADRFPLNLDLSWDDFGRDYTGRQRFTSVLGLDNVIGFGDKIYAGAILSQDSQGVLAGYQIPIGPYGTRLGVDYSYSNVYIGGPYRDQNMQGKANCYSLKLIQPIINTATKELSASVSVDAINTTSQNTGAQDYNLRVLRTGLYGMFDDKGGRTIPSIGVDIGTNGLGASDNVDNSYQSVFYKVVASIMRIQRLPKNCLGVFRLNGQYSPQSLYSAEQMFIGGVYSVRGYQPGELLGDYGFAGSIEIRTPVPGLQKVLPNKIKSWSDKVKLAFFYDWGYIGENVVQYDYPNKLLQSVGVGTYINLTDAIYFQAGIGIPVGLKSTNSDNPRFYFSINTDIDRIFLKPKERL